MNQILVVDDDTEVRENLMDLLSEAGFDVRGAASGPIALEMAAERPMDVALLDLIMPDMDGMETLLALKKAHPKLKVIMLTAFATVDNAVTAIKKGASDYLSKPFKPDELIITIRRAIEESKFERDVRYFNLDEAFASLSNPIRRNILQLLGRHPTLRLTELALELSIRDHTKVAFHLRTLKKSGMVTQMRDKSYCLTDMGKRLLSGLYDLKGRLSNAKERKEADTE